MVIHKGPVDEPSQTPQYLPRQLVLGAIMLARALRYGSFNITGRRDYEGFLRTCLVREKYSPPPGIYRRLFQRAIVFISTALTQLDELERSVNRDFDIQREVFWI